MPSSPCYSACRCPSRGCRPHPRKPTPDCRPKTDSRASNRRANSSRIRYPRSIGLLQNSGNRNLRLLLYENIGNYFRYKKDYAQALNYYHEARQMALADSNISTYASLAYELSILFAQ